MRWAMVGSGTRKARAISGVERPPSSRSVKATWASGASAGWQQVNIEPESIVLHGGFLFGLGRQLGGRALAWRSCRRIPAEPVEARLRAVVMIQPAGLGGRPSSRHRSRRP